MQEYENTPQQMASKLMEFISANHSELLLFFISELFTFIFVQSENPKMSYSAQSLKIHLSKTISRLK